MNTEINIEEMRNMLYELPAFILKKFNSIIEEYNSEKDEAQNIVFETCPKCKIINPSVIRGGITRKGKQMYRCTSCRKRFVADHNEVTFYSRLSKDQWNEAIRSAVSGNSIDEAASLCSVSHITAFKMRHKIMAYLEKNEDSIIVSDKVELDEKYLQKSHKGKKIEGIKSRHRGIKASKRGISDEKICLLTAVERDGESFLRAYNMGRPTSEDVMNIKSHIKKESYLWTDNHQSYNKLTEELDSKRVIISSHEDYDKVNHLDNVNCFHSQIQRWYTEMKGVSTKYINRYAALFNVRWLMRGVDKEEMLLKAKKRIKSLGRFVQLNWKIMGTAGIFKNSVGI